MALSKEDRILIKVLRQEKGYNALRFLKEFRNKHWSRRTLERLISQIDKTGSVEKREKCGRPRTSRNPENINKVEELVLSQEDAAGTHRTGRQIAREIGISRTSVRRIIDKDLNLKCFKRKRAQELSEANKITRLVRVKQLLKKYPKHLVEFIWFTDEKLFTVASPTNFQNDRLYAPRATTKKMLPAARLLRTR